VDAVAFSPNGLFVASGSRDNTVRIWVTATAQCQHVFTDHHDWVTCLAFSPDSNRVASGSFDNTVRVWYIYNGSLIRTFNAYPFAHQAANAPASPARGLTEYVLTIAFSPDSNCVMSGSWNGIIRMWCLPSKGCQSKLLNIYKICFNEWMASMAFCVTDNHIQTVAGTQSGVVKQFHLPL
jgi:WD40 repeat protein